MTEDVDFSKTTESIMTDFNPHGLRSECRYQWYESSSTQLNNLCTISRKMNQMADEFEFKFENRYGEPFMNIMENQVRSKNAYSTFESDTKELFTDCIDCGRMKAKFCSWRGMVQLHIEELISWITEEKKRGKQFIGHFWKDILQLVLPTYRRMVYLLRAMWLFLAVILSTSPGARTKLKHGVSTTAKVTKLILWVCGDVETNPGPGNSRSEILRKFRKSQQSAILILLYEHSDKSSVPKSLYKEKPNWWPNDTPFVNITNHKKDDESVACFGKCIEIFKISVSCLSQDWNYILKFYNDLLNRKGDDAYLDMCKDKLLEWIDNTKNQRALQTVDINSFMDDFRLKLKIFENLVNQGESIPDDIAEKFSAVHLSMVRSNRKRNQDSATGESFYPQKRQNVSFSDVPSDIVSTIDYQPRFEPQKGVEQSKTSDVDTDFSSGQIIHSNDCSMASSSGEKRQLVPINETLDDAERSFTNTVTELPSKDNRTLYTGSATSASPELPSDELETLIDEYDEDDFVNNFDINFLEHLNGDLCFDE